MRYGKHLDADKAAVIGLYHDASEIITGDMPTPIKYYNNRMKDLFHSIEDEACEKLIGQLPGRSADILPGLLLQAGR